MEHLTGQEPSNKNIKFDYDEFSFRSVNQGLGFHQKTENPLRQQTIKSDKKFEKIERPKEQIQKKQIIEVALPQVIAVAVEKKAALPLKKSPNLVDVFFAYTIDLALITGTFLFSIGMMFLIASFMVEVESLGLLLTSSFLSVAAALYSGIYLIYFSILDVSGTPGKNIYKFKLVKATGNEATFKESFARALVCLLSAIAFFVPVFLDFHSKLSDSKNIQN